jgi:SAM-dependent methyltransferase
MSKITEAELAAMPPKAVRYEEEVKIYQDNDFLAAYALHTEKRIRETSYKHAIGGGENWEEHGDVQKQFLIKQGLLPHHRFLDIGCGTGRLARKLVPYLDAGNYVGLDISAGALDVARKLANEEDWYNRSPQFILGDLPGDAGPFDFAWAFSVFIHLPLDIAGEVIRRVGLQLRTPASELLFSYVPNEVEYRSGLKQFKHTLGNVKGLVAGAGLTFEEVKDWVFNTIGERPDWAGHQKIACARRKI